MSEPRVTVTVGRGGKQVMFLRSPFLSPPLLLAVFFFVIVETERQMSSPQGLRFGFSSLLILLMVYPFFHKQIGLF
jgi:uncharacterized membrane protein YfhO